MIFLSFHWKEVAHSAEGWLHSFSPSANPLPFGHPPSMGRGIDGLLIPLLPPSFGRRWRVAPEVGFALFRFQPTPLPWEGGRWVTHPASPSSGRWWRVAPEVGFALFRRRPTPCPSGIPLPWEGGMGYSSRFSLLWKVVARSAGGWLRSLSPSANPLPFGHPPSMGRG